MTTILTTLLTSTVGCNIKTSFIAAIVPTWVPGSLCTLHRITGLLLFKLCLCASLGKARKFSSKRKSVPRACAGICLIAPVFLRFDASPCACLLRGSLPTTWVDVRFLMLTTLHSLWGTYLFLPGELSVSVERFSPYNLSLSRALGQSSCWPFFSPSPAVTPDWAILSQILSYD